MISRIGAVTCLAVLLLCQAQGLWAHSIKDLKRITLSSKKLVVDQVAFYLESYVNKQPDEDGIRYRYQLWEFKDIRHKGDIAEVHTMVNDQKTATQSPEVFYLQRNPDSTWNHVDSKGNVIAERIHTYVNQDGSISSGGHENKAAGGLREIILAALMAVLIIYLLIRRKRKTAMAMKGAEH